MMSDISFMRRRSKWLNRSMVLYPNIARTNLMSVEIHSILKGMNCILVCISVSYLKELTG